MKLFQYILMLFNILKLKSNFKILFSSNFFEIQLDPNSWNEEWK